MNSQASPLWSESTLLNLMELTSDAVLVVDAGGVLLEVNDSACQLLMCSRTDLIGQSLAVYFSPAVIVQLGLLLDGISLSSPGSSAFPTTEPIRIETCINFPQTNSALPVEVRATVLPDGRWIAFLRPLAASQLESQQSLDNAQQTLDALMTYIPDGVTIADAPDVVIQRVSRYGQQLLGRTAETLEGIPVETHVQIWDIYHPDGVTLAENEALPLTRAVQQGEIVTNEEWVLRRSDGQQIVVLCNAGPINDSDGRITGGVIVWRDITERKRTELALLDKEQQLQQLSDSLPQFVWIADTAGGLEYVNRQWVEYSGLSLEQSRDAVLMQQCHHPDDWQQVYDQWTVALETQQPFEVEGRLRRSSDGMYRWFLIRAVPVLNSNGRVLRWYGTSTDIHDRKLAELNEQFLKDLDLRLRQLPDADAMIWEVVSRVGQYLKVDHCLWHRVDLEAEIITVDRDWRRRAEIPSIVGIYPLLEMMLPQQIRQYQETAQPAIVENVATYPSTAPFASNYLDLGVRAFVAVPCVREGQWVAHLTVNSETVRLWRPDEVSLLQETVARLWSLIEQMQAAQALRESEARFRTLADNIAQLAWIADPTGSIFWYNQRWFDYTGTTFEEMQGWGWQSVHHPDHLDRVVARFRRSVEAGEAWEDTFPLRGQDGQYRWFLSRAIPIRDEAGKTLRWFGTNTDITDRQQAEADLQERNRHVQLLYETTRDLLSTDRPLGMVETLFAKLRALLGVDMYINYLLDESQQQLHLKFYGGIPADTARDIEWLPLDRAICGTVAQNRCQIVQSNLQDSTDPRTELVRSLGLAAYSCQPLVAQGKLFGTLGFGSRSRTAFTSSETDLFQALCDQIAIALERSELVTSLQQQTEELARVNRLKDDFFSALSHELRTPLNPILGWAQMLQSANITPTRTTDAFKAIERNARQMVRLVDDLLDVARTIRGGLQLQLQTIDLTLILSQAIETVQFAAQAKNIAIQYSPVDVIYTQGDSDRLQQIFWNLLSNAIKFTPAGGRVEVDLQMGSRGAGEQGSRGAGEQGSRGAEEQRSRGAEEQGSDRSAETINFSSSPHPPIPSSPHPLTPSPLPFVQITITDTGIGIAPDFLPHVFEYFRQAESGSTRSYGGLGLGLAIVRQLIELHGGTIAVSSEGLGQGTTFTVCLPLLGSRRAGEQGSRRAGEQGGKGALEQESQGNREQRPTPSFPHPPISSPPHPPALRVLLLDDEPDNLALLQFLLEQEGLDVTAVSSPQRALDLIAQSPPDVLISDIGMPEMDGYELIERVRATDSGRQIPAIALTAFAQPEDQQRAIQAGFQTFIAKPIDPVQVLEAVAQLVP